MCAILDTNVAVLYGKYLSDMREKTLPPCFRKLLCDDAVEKVVTPAVMDEVWGMCRNGRIDKGTARNLKKLSVSGGAISASLSESIAGAIEAEQRRLAYLTESESAVRWLAAKRRHHEKATGKDYGPVVKMRPIKRYENMTKLCDMAAGDRRIMGEAGALSRGRGRTVLLSSDVDMSLFEGAMKRAAGSDIGVVAPPHESRGGRKRTRW